MRGFAIGFAVILACWALPASAQKTEMSLFDGACATESNIAGTPFGCELMVSTNIDQGYDGVVLVFMHKTEGGGGMIAIGGVRDPDGTLRAQTVQYRPGEPVAATGDCAFTRKGRKIKSVRCTVVTGSGADERRSTIEFTPTREHRM
ncbi:MAG: hypothetical protein ACAH11_14550 [Sphingomonas sp.]